MHRSETEGRRPPASPAPAAMPSRFLPDAYNSRAHAAGSKLEFKVCLVGGGGSLGSMHCFSIMRRIPESEREPDGL